MKKNPYISFIVVIFLLFSNLIFNYGKAEAKNSFKDVPTNYWAADEIDYLSTKGIISGFKDGSFKPGQYITRGQAAIMLTKALSLSTQNRPNPNLKDVSTRSPYYKPVSALADENIIDDLIKDGYYYPGQLLTRGEMAAILAKSYGLGGTSTEKYIDVPDYYWAYDYIQSLAANHITTGFSDKTFRPNQPLTRAEFSVFLSRIMDSKFRSVGNRTVYLDNGIEEMNFQKGYSDNRFSSYYNADEYDVVESNTGEVFKNYFTMYIDRWADPGNGWAYVEFPLNGRYETFSTIVGLTKQYQNTTDEIHLKFTADGQPLKNMTWTAGMLTENVTLNVKGKKVLRIYMEVADPKDDAELGFFNPVFTLVNEPAPLISAPRPSKTVVYNDNGIKMMNFQKGYSDNRFSSYYNADEYDVIESNTGEVFKNYFTMYIDRWADPGNGWSYVEYPLNGKYKTFKATVGLTKRYQNTTNNMTLIFSADQQPLKTMTWSAGMLTQDVSIDVTGKKILRIYVEVPNPTDTSEIGFFNPIFIKN
ncbi:S-layer homology domain-containing protein [Bacillus smithii]|uniref:S-layer homology domain-containing protein n=1 Tax=Bacillus smithii TaxID=1479 RepID=UPI0030C8D7D1